MKNSTKNLFRIMLILALVAVVGYGYVTTYVSGLIEKTATAKVEIENLESQYSHLKALHKAAENTSDESSKISSYIIRPGGSVEFITNIEQVAAAGGLVYNTDKIEAISTPELDASQKELLEISFSVKGPWSSLVRFLKLIENMPYGIKIQKFELTSLADAKAEVLKSITIPASTTGSATVIKKSGSQRENNWKAVVLIDVVKDKDI